MLAAAPFAPFDADGLDHVAGMGAQNVAQFGTAGQGEPAMRKLVGQVASAVRDHAANMDHGLSGGDEGWVADLATLTSPWGFDLGDITAPVELWHGTADHDP